MSGLRAYHSWQLKDSGGPSGSGGKISACAASRAEARDDESNGCRRGCSRTCDCMEAKSQRSQTGDLLDRWKPEPGNPQELQIQPGGNSCGQNYWPEDDCKIRTGLGS